MNTFYAVYDADGDGMTGDCAYLGEIEAESAEQAMAEARAIWPSIINLRVAP